MKILWSDFYWDGPISGVCLYEGRPAYFETGETGGWFVDEGKECWCPRVWKVYSLSRLEYFMAKVSHWYWRLCLKVSYFPEFVKPAKGKQIGAALDSELLSGWRAR